MESRLPKSEKSEMNIGGFNSMPHTRGLKRPISTGDGYTTEARKCESGRTELKDQENRHEYHISRTNGATFQACSAFDGM